MSRFSQLGLMGRLSMFLLRTAVLTGCFAAGYYAAPRTTYSDRWLMGQQMASLRCELNQRNEQLQETHSVLSATQELLDSQLLARREQHEQLREARNRADLAEGDLRDARRMLQSYAQDAEDTSWMYERSLSPDQRILRKQTHEAQMLQAVAVGSAERTGTSFPAVASR